MSLAAEPFLRDPSRRRELRLRLASTRQRFDEFAALVRGHRTDSRRPLEEAGVYGTGWLGWRHPPFF